MAHSTKQVRQLILLLIRSQVIHPILLQVIFCVYPPTKDLTSHTTTCEIARSIPGRPPSTWVVSAALLAIYVQVPWSCSRWWYQLLYWLYMFRVPDHTYVGDISYSLSDLYVQVPWSHPRGWYQLLTVTTTSPTRMISWDVWRRRSVEHHLGKSFHQKI